MRVIEVTASKTIKRSLRPYESEDHFAAVKLDVGDTDPAEALRAAQVLVDAAVARVDPRQPANAEHRAEAELGDKK